VGVAVVSIVCVSQNWSAQMNEACLLRREHLSNSDPGELVFGRFPFRRSKTLIHLACIRDLSRDPWQGGLLT
jgi:hypothetical protein